MPNVSFYSYGFCLQFANLETRNFHCNGHKCNSHCMIFMQTKRLYTAPHIFARMKTVLLVWDLHAPNGPIIANANKKKIIATKYANHNCTFSIASIYSNTQYFTLCLCMYVWVGMETYCWCIVTIRAVLAHNTKKATIFYCSLMVHIAQFVCIPFARMSMWWEQIKTHRLPVLLCRGAVVVVVQETTMFTFTYDCLQIFLVCAYVYHSIVSSI